MILGHAGFYYIQYYNISCSFSQGKFIILMVLISTETEKTGSDKTKTHLPDSLNLPYIIGGLQCSMAAKGYDSP